MDRHQPEQKPHEVRAQEIIMRTESALRAAVEAVGASAESNPLEIFPEPGERRADTEFELGEDQETAFRSAMAELGIGRETDRGASEIGLHDGYTYINEGGQAHKMLAELQVAVRDKVKPGSIIIAASDERKLPPSETDKVNERAITAKVLGIDESNVADTEYGVAKQMLGCLDGFVAEDETSLPFSYTGDNQVQTDDTGQFVRVGSIDGKSVVMMRIDREYYQDESGDTKYRQPGTVEVIRIVSGVMQSAGDETSEIGLGTSSTYQPSREIDVIRAMDEVSRGVGVITYGMETLAAVKQESGVQPPALGQLAAEAHKAATQLSKVTR